MKKLLIVAIASFFLISCDSQNALKFNDKLVDIQKTLIREIDMSTMTVGIDVNKLKKVRESAKEKIEEIKALKAPDGGEDFKKAMIDDLQAIYDLYDLTIKMNDPKLSEAEQDKAEKDFNIIQSKADMYDNKVIQEQRKFAKKYNFEIQ